MADAAAAQILQSAAPGQFDDIVAQLGRLGASFGNLEILKQAHQHAQGIGSTTNSSLSNPLATELKDKLLKYHQRAFSGVTGRGGNSTKKVTIRVWLLPGASDSQFQICSFAEKLDLQNMQTGFWKSTWTVTTTTKTQAELQGSIEVHTYSYEDGNTQLQLSKTFSPEIVQEMKSDQDVSLANGITFKIADWEHQVLGILKGLHELTAESLKTIRRVLPITKTKMNWEVEAQRGITFLKQTAKR